MREPFDRDGEHYRFAHFVSDTFPVQRPRPDISFGGSSEAAYAVGGGRRGRLREWGEPPAETAAQIERVHAADRAASRTKMPRIQVAFRPIIAPTQELAWEKVHRSVARNEAMLHRNSRCLLSIARPSASGPQTPGRSGSWQLPSAVSDSTVPSGRRRPRPARERATPTR